MAKLNTFYTSHKRGSKGQTAHKSRSNMNLVGYGISVFAIIVIAQIFRWQVIDSDKFTALAEEQYSSSGIQSATRGNILASDGTILAVDEPAWNIYASLSQNETDRELFFSQKEKYISTISAILGIESSEIEAKLTDDFVYVLLANDIETDKKKALENADIFGENTEGFGFYFENIEKRIYPNGTLAAHILGFIGSDSDGEQVGQYGIQGYYFGDLTGKEGYTYEEKDSSGNVILTSEYEPILPREGKDFTLTIIPSIQAEVEEQLEAGVKETRSKSGSVIVMDPQTGAILAMANYPTYDPNEYWRTSEAWILKNRAVSDVYEYGSVQKPITFAIALETGAIASDYTCNDQTGSLNLYDVTGYEDLKGRYIYTWNRKANGLLTIAGILAKSNNPCTAQVALRTDFSKFYSLLKEFGIGEFVGIGLQEESTSYLMPYEEWTKLDLITASFGQGISATPLQIISALATIANDGKRMRPYIISQITDDNETITIEPQVVAQPVSKETADIVTQALVDAVQQDSLGVAAADLKEYDLAAKTGTAQIAKQGSSGYEETVTNATAIGYAPAESPKFIMLVKLEEPQTSTYATLSAVPVWQNIFNAISDDLEIPKKN